MYIPSALAARSFNEAKAAAKMIDTKVTELSEVLNSFPKGPMGLTPDYVRATAEYKKAKSQYDLLWKQLRSFNKWYTVTFKAELAVERRARYANRNQGMIG